VVVAAFALSLGFVAWLALGWGGHRAVLIVDDVGTAAAAFAAASTCALAATRNVGKARRFWLLLTAGMLSWAAAECGWGWYELVLDREVPLPSLVDVGYLAAIPLMVGALLAHPAARPDASRTRATLDGAALATSLLFLSWLFILAPLADANSLGTVAGVVTAAYPFGDVILLFLVIRALWALSGPGRRPMAWIMFGLLAMALSDSGYTYLTAVRDYTTGSVIDAGWFVAYLSVAVGGWFGARVSGLAVPAAGAEVTQTAALLAPYVPLLVALGVIATRTSLGDEVDATSRALAYALAGLVLLRQFARTRTPVLYEVARGRER
jgi:hypothetical protein